MKTVSLIAVLMLVVVGCGEALPLEESALQAETLGSELVAGDPMIAVWRHNIHQFRAYSNGSTSHTINAGSCWPVGTPVFRNITLVSSSGNVNTYRADRYLNTCTNTWTNGVTFTVTGRGSGSYLTEAYGIWYFVSW